MLNCARCCSGLSVSFSSQIAPHIQTDLAQIVDDLQLADRI